MSYLHTHPWQRRLLTGSMALVLGALAAVLLYPRIRDYRVIRDLGSQDPDVRSGAIRRAVAIGRSSRATVGRLQEALDTPDDRKFAAIVTVLRILQEFDSADPDPRHVDRIRAIEIETTHSPAHPEVAARTRAMILGTMNLSGRDNRYVRRALASGARDESPRVRSVAALLAARLADDPTLKKLLGDEDPSVAAAAARDAGLAGRAGLAREITGLLTGGKDAETVSAAACGLARLQPEQSARQICEILSSTRDEKLRNRMLHAAVLLRNDAARAAVANVLDGARGAAAHPPAMALVAAGRLKVAAAGPHVKRVLSAAVNRDPDLTMGQLLAALAAADRLKLPARQEVHAICNTYWTPDPNYTLVLMAAARALGRQADLAQGKDAGAPTRDQCIRTLRLAAGQADQTPLPSAAAAVALWELDPAATYWIRESSDPEAGRLIEWRKDPNSSAMYVQQAVQADSTLPGDYAAWWIGRSGRPEAFALGLAMLPELGAPVPLRVYSGNARAAGAMLLALAARTRQQIDQARQRIRSRLVGGPLGGESDPYVRGAYQCALLILGETRFRREVHRLLLTEEFPQRRAVTALCAAGNREALDWILADLHGWPQDVPFLLINTAIGEVLEAVSPELPRVDAAADQDTQMWQARILQDYYRIHRRNVRLGRED